MNEKNEEEPKQKNEINNINPEEEKVAEKNTQTNNDIINQKNEESEIFLGKTILNKYRIEKKNQTWLTSSNIFRRKYKNF